MLQSLAGSWLADPLTCGVSRRIPLQLRQQLTRFLFLLWLQHATLLTRLWGKHQIPELKVSLQQPQYVTLSLSLSLFVFYTWVQKLLNNDTNFASVHHHSRF